MDAAYLEYLSGEISALHEAGLYKSERVITSPQSASISVKDGQEVLNFCANNYLGLADHPASGPRLSSETKPWLAATNCPTLFDAISSRRCRGCPSHAPCIGRRASRSESYTP